MLKLVKRDSNFTFGSKGTLLLLLATPPLTLFLIGDRQVYSIFAMLSIILVHIMTTISFGMDAKNNSHILFKSLPTSTMDVVGSKYLLIFINFILSIVYICVVAIFMDYLKLIHFDFNIISKEIIIYLLMSNTISLSIALPIIFFSSAKIGDLLGRIAMIITLNLSSYSLYAWDGELNIELLNKFNNPKFIIGVFIGMLVSIFLSVYIYNEKEFRE